MKVRVLEDNAYLKKGVIDLPDNVARELISKGFAVVIREKEKAIDKQAHDSLNDAKSRDQQQS